MKNRKANRLISEQSPYLLQHAYNPVDWFPWGEEAWEKARSEDKLVIISIGYSACHWCHVMEHQSFEDYEVAAVMNESFVSIKVDREERPDIDAVYMEAVQLMTGRGGWPLNCIALPDGRPVYGGTYFPKEAWLQVLDNLQEIYMNDPAKVQEYASRLHQGLRESELIKTNPEGTTQVKADIKKTAAHFISHFDKIYGGPDKAPKFPMPCNLEFLLNYGIIFKDQQVLDHVALTLTKMAWGGIFDQLAGGFARYSVDEKWKVPHFEKMLYDNGQLIGLYAKAFAHYQDPLYREVVEKTIDFVNREWKAPEGIFYSALDADSEGEEGRYYVWTKEELEELLDPKEMEFVSAYYSINDFGFWEHGNYVLIREKDDEEVRKALNMDARTFIGLKESADNKMLRARKKRVRPGLDDKALLAWNALLLKGLAEAAAYLHREDYLQQAADLHRNIQKCFCDQDGKWYRSYKKEQRTIEAFSEDLALLADAQLVLYEAGFDREHFHETMRILAILDRDFYDPETGMYFFTAHHANELVVRRTEIFDNVIQSPNSVLAGVLYKAGMLSGQQEWTDRSKKMLNSVARYFENAPQALAGWLNAWLMAVEQQEEIAVVGHNYKDAVAFLRETYRPLIVWCAAATAEGWSLLTDRFITGQTTIYECKNKACNLPIKFS